MDLFNTKKYVNSLFSQEANYSYKREIFDDIYKQFKLVNVCLIGLRQVGKTTLMIQLAKKYFDEFINIEESMSKNDIKVSSPNKKDYIFYLNIKSIPDINNSNIRNMLFNEVTKNKYKLVVLDEIQEIDEWTNFLQAAIDLNKKCKFIVSGSNATKLNQELMVGRVKTFFIQPLLYSEYLKIWLQKDSENTINDYLMFGSYPKLNNYCDPEIQYKEIVESTIIDKIIIEDLKQKPDMNKFKSLLKNINDYIGNEINASQIENTIRVSRQTVPEYLNMMEKARMVHTICRYNDKNIKRKKKVYYEDKSMINLFSNNNLNNNLIGSLIENVVFNYLTYRYTSSPTLTEINYYRNEQDKEVDFVIKNEKLLIECKYVESINVEDVSLELNNNIKNEKEFIDYKKIVITKNYKNDDVNGWKFVCIGDFLRGMLWN